MERPWRGVTCFSITQVFQTRALSVMKVLGSKMEKEEVVLPLGFDYYATAAVQCDGGAQIRSEESRPVQKIRVDAGHIPTELTFVMPTERCKLWRPPTPVRK